MEISSFDHASLGRYLSNQLSNFFPDGQSFTRDIEQNLDGALDRLSHCFAAINHPLYSNGTQTFFDPFFTDQNATFLYFLSNTIFREGGNQSLANRIYALNKALHGIDVFYEVELPEIFVLSHCVGTVLGRASYGNYFLVYQNVTIGAARQAPPGESNIYPKFGTHCSVYAGAAVLGSCEIGDGSKVSAQSLVLDQKIAPNSVYIGKPESHVIKPSRKRDQIWR